MNNIISPVSSAKKYSFNILDGQTVTITERDNPYNFELATLLSTAARQNKKRGFLFVSKVLGKHIPINPHTGLLAGMALGAKLLQDFYETDCGYTEQIVKALKDDTQAEKVYEAFISAGQAAIPDSTVFIGFAETATALGYSMFSFFKDSYYIHTTREQIPELNSWLNFTEEHSHAMAHRCYLREQKSLVNAKSIVLIDDEITTGKTALNMIREIHRQLPGKRYIVASLLDWRTKEDRTRYKEFAQELDIQIDNVSLISGEIQVTGQPYHEEENSAINFRAQNDFSYEQRELKLDDVIAVISEDSFGMLNKSPYLNSTGRFGVSTSDYNESSSVAEVIGRGLKSDRKGKKTLCLGTGEFMFFPMLLSSQMGEGVMYQSSTRSPIYPVDQENYAIKNRVVYPSPDDPSISNYLYNIPQRYYDEVYIFIEREVERKRLQPMINAIGSLGIPRIVVVTCT